MLRSWLTVIRNLSIVLHKEARWKFGKIGYKKLTETRRRVYYVDSITKEVKSERKAK